LRDLIAGKALRCEYSDDSLMGQFWSRGSHITRGGAQVYSGDCFIGDESVSTMMLSAGLATFDNNGWEPIIVPDGKEKYMIYTGFKHGASEPKGPVHQSIVCSYLKDYLRKDEWFFPSPR